MTDTAYNRLLKRVVSDPKVLGGEPRIRGTRIHVAVVLDSLAEGLTPAQSQIIFHRSLKMMCEQPWLMRRSWLVQFQPHED